MLMELLSFLLSLTQFFVDLVFKIKNKKEKNNNRCPEQVTVIIILIEK